MGNVATAFDNAVIWAVVTNYSDENLVVSTPGYVKVIIRHGETAKAVSMSASLSIGNDSLCIYDIDHRRVSDYKDNLVFTLGDHCVFYTIVSPIEYHYKVVRMSVPMEDTNNYGNLLQFGIDMCRSSSGAHCGNKYCKEFKPYIYNNSTQDIIIYCAHFHQCVRFKLRPGQKTCYSGKYVHNISDFTVNKDNLQTYIKDNKIIYERNVYYQVQISNTTHDVITCVSGDKNLFVLPRSYVEINNVKKILTMKGNELTIPLRDQVSVQRLDGYVFNIDATSSITKISVSVNE